MMTRFITNEQHYSEVIASIASAKQYVWIGTADIKDLHVKYNGMTVSLLHVLNALIKRGVSIRLIYAKEPGVNYQNSFDKYPALWGAMECALCPRVHFKHIIIDGVFAYAGSANLTGAGLGMKSPNRRNFESGIVSTQPELVQAIMQQFDKVWMGKYCRACGRKVYCKAPIK